MTEDEKKEWELIEKELLNYDLSDDALLADIADILKEETSADTPNPLPEEDPILQALDKELLAEKEDPLQARRAARAKKKTPSTNDRDDKWVISLLITACFLSIGIIGVLIYWLENFLK